MGSWSVLEYIDGMDAAAVDTKLVEVSSCGVELQCPERGAESLSHLEARGDVFDRPPPLFFYHPHFSVVMLASVGQRCLLTNILLVHSPILNAVQSAN